MEDRKLKEIEWADQRRTIDHKDKIMSKKYLSNMKYYSVVRKTTEFINSWIKQNCINKDIFEIACGNGGYSLKAMAVAKSCTAADIAPVSIEQAINNTKTHPIFKNIKYLVLDCESTGLPDNSFDVVCEGGALHHMELDSVYNEVVRLLRPGGMFLCTEAIKHNPIIHLYRKLTPHLRTKWEADHILGKSQIMKGKEYFEDIELHFFNLATILAVPFKRTFIFLPLLTFLEKVDNLLLKIPGIRWMAWQSVFILKNPRKNNTVSK